MISHLIDQCERAGLNPVWLDDLVHDTASQIASSANNGGLEDQITFLVSQLGEEDTEREVQGILADFSLL